MPHKNQTTISPWANVKTEPLLTRDGRPSSRFAVILDPDGLHQEVGVVSRDYKLVPNRAVAEVAHDVLQKTGFNYDDHQILFDGKHFRQRFLLHQFQGEPKVGDVVKVVVDSINSYDGSTKFGLEFNALRLACDNGLMLSFMLGGFRFKHWGDRSFDDELQQASQQIGNVGDRLHFLMPQLTEMTHKRVKRPDIQQVFKKTDLPLTLQAKVFNAIEEDTQWGLYNAFTNVFSRMENFHGENMNRWISKYFLSPN